MAQSHKPKAKKQKNRRNAPTPKIKQSPRPESSAAEGATVAWMLAALGAGVTELVALLAMAALAYEPLAAALPERASVFPWLMLFVALITGTITLLLTPLVLKQRQTPPPQSVVNFAIFVGVAAWALFIASNWF